MDYVALSQAIQEYVDNQEPTFLDMIPTFVKQAEERIYRSVMIPELRKAVTSSTVAGNQYLTRPADFISMFSFAVNDGGNYVYLTNKDVSFIREAYPSSSTQAVPRYYAEYTGTTDTSPGVFILGPTPASSYAVEMQYYYNPVSIVDANTTWLGDNASNVLLYAALVEAYTFMKGDGDMLKQYTAQYKDALGLLAGLGARLRRDDYRNGQVG